MIKPRGRAQAVKNLYRNGLVFLVLAAAASLPAGGFGARGGQEMKPLQHDVRVTLKLIQVFVTDDRGRPVKNLRRDDFVLYDDGRLTAITEFEQHAAAAAAPAPPARPATAPAPDDPDRPEVLLTRIPRKFILLFDFAYNNQRGIAMAKEAALHFMDKKVRPEDEVGIVTYSLTRGLSIPEFLTLDHRKIRAAVARMSSKAIAGRGDDIEQEYWRQVTESEAPKPRSGEADPPDISSIFVWKRQETKNEALNYILKLTALAKGLRYIPGIKNVVLFSTGIASSLIYGAQAGAPEQAKDPSTVSGYRALYDTGDHVLRTRNEEMLKELSASNCTIFTFDMREAALVPSLFAYDEETFWTRQRDLFREQGVHQNNSLIFKDDRFTGLYSLRRMAKTTGGKYFSNMEEYEQNLEELQAMTGSYYVLGYPVAAAQDGEFHSLRVEVKRKGCEVRAQTGYFNPKPFRDYDDFERQLHLLDLALSPAPHGPNPLPAYATALAAPAGPGGNTVLVTEIPEATLARLTGSKVEIVTFLFDQHGNLADLRRIQDRLSAHAGRDVYVSTRASLPPGGYSCRVVVRDMESGEAATASTAFFVPDPGAGFRLQAPLALAPAGKAAYIEGRVRPSETSVGAGASWTSLYAFDASRYAPLLGPLPRGTERISVILPFELIAIDSPRIGLRASFLNAATGERLALPLLPTGQNLAPGAVVQTFEIPAAGLAPGRYVIYFLAEETTTKALSHASIPLIVR